MTRSVRAVLRILQIVLCAQFCAPVFVFAATYPWVQIGRDDIVAYENPRADVEFLIHLIDQAQAGEPINIINYDQRPDGETTLPLLQALRRAADRGCPVRWVVAWLPQFMFDREQIIPRFLK